MAVNRIWLLERAPGGLEHSPIDSDGIPLGNFARIGIDEAADRHGIAGHRGDGVAGNRDPAKLRTQADGICNRVEPAREGRAIDRSPAERHGQRRKEEEVTVFLTTH